MKLSWSLLASSLCCIAAAVRPHLSPETSRLIIAQRLGVSRFHSIERTDSETIRHLNTFGGGQQRLFGEDDVATSKVHLLMWIEDAEQEEATVIINDGAEKPLDFTIVNPPQASDNARLLQDFIQQTESLPERADPQKTIYSSRFEIEDVLTQHKKVEIHNNYLSVFHVSKADELSSAEMDRILNNVAQKARELKFSVTIVMLPASKTHFKRSTNTWGAYKMPLREARREGSEALLSSHPEPSSKSDFGVSNLEDFPMIAFAEDTTPVRGILPSCFTSLTACQKQTRNCTAHGECKLLHKGRGSGNERESVDCYGCACSPTKLKDKTTYWGGPACQKRDISVEFWLFVGSGVMLAFLISAGIGMLYSMGSEELPSVIGAGVSGPVRK